MTMTHIVASRPFLGASAAASLLVALVLMSCGIVDVVNSSCATAGRCCQGKDNHCQGQIQQQQLDAEDEMENKLELLDADGYSNRTKKTCFCDSACIDIGDCCSDYKQHCPPVDCVLADGWQPWTDCSVRCGLGTHQRLRRVLRSPMNGGRPCDVTVQKAICYGTNCKQTRAQGNIEMRETAKLLPVTLGEWRRNKLYNPYLDIRRNLYEKMQNDVHNSLSRPSYCAVYELTDVRSSCAPRRNHKASPQDSLAATEQQQSWTGNLTKGAHVCAECQPTAMQTKLGGRCKGAGLHRRETPWMALSVPGCHGSWVMKTRQEECRCNDERMLNLILV